MTRTRSIRRIRARDLGIPFDGVAGRFNAITDVAGVEVGHATIVRGAGRLVTGRGPVRTGVTAILPRGRNGTSPVFAGWFSLNGNGEMTGTAWIEESGLLCSPVMITNTHSVGVVRDAVIEWQLRGRGMIQPWSLPVVAETWDGYLNDTNGFHVKARHAFGALRAARAGEVAEGNVGGGTGMIGYGWKGGIGTSSRIVRIGRRSHIVGILVQLNCGGPTELVVAGVPVGRHLRPPGSNSGRERGSIIIVAATDAPVMPHQLKRIARRLTMGLARTGSVSGNGSGDLFLAFSTANPMPRRRVEMLRLSMLDNSAIDPIFRGAVEAAEEAIVNALIAARTMTGIDDRTIHAIPHDELREVLRTCNRIVD